jgi:IclR family KDG regulon transcriptional repressor
VVGNYLLFTGVTFVVVVKSIVKAIDILEYILNSNNSPTIAQIASQLKLNRTTAYHLIQTLQSRGYLIKDENGIGYQVGLKFISFTAKVLDNNRLRIEALPYLQELAQISGGRVNLGILYDEEVLYLAGVEKPSLPSVYTRFGKRAPAHCSSLGKVILAHWPKERVDQFLKQKPPIRFTENTITDPHLFKQHLAEIRSQGYAIDHQEHLPGVYCVAALIRGIDGDGIGSISISSGDLVKVKDHIQNLLQTAEILSHRMGHTLR